MSGEPVTAVWPLNDDCLFPDRPRLAPRAAPVPHQTRPQVGAPNPSLSTRTVRCMGWRRLPRIERANGGPSIPRATSSTRRRSPSCGRADRIKRRPPKRRPQAEGRMPMRASARERAHTATLASRSVEKVKTTNPCGRVAAAFGGLGSPPAENPCIAPGVGLKLQMRLGCRPAARFACYRTAENKPTEPGRACPVKGVRH